MKNSLEKTMNFEQGGGLEAFAILFLKNRGAVVEKDENGFEVLLPEELSGFLDTPEHLKIDKTSSPSDTKNGYSISFGSPLLEKMVDMACTQAPIVVCELSFDYLKSQGFDRLVREHINFPGTVGNVESAAKVKTSYLLINCRYLAQSDEQKEGLIELLFNYETGAFVSNKKTNLAGIARNYTDTFTLTWDRERMKSIVTGIEVESKVILEDEIEPFRESMTRRFRRDVANLDEYYGALKDEMEKSLQRPGLSEEIINDRRTKIALLPDEFNRKKDDLFKKYSINIKIQPCAAMFIRTPAVSLLYSVAAGRKKMSLSLTYNPLTHSIDPLVCQGCGRSISTIYWCDKSRLLCFECRQNRPLC